MWESAESLHAQVHVVLVRGWAPLLRLFAAERRGAWVPRPWLEAACFPGRRFHQYDCCKGVGMRYHARAHGVVTHMSVPFSSYPFSLLLSMPSAGDDPSVRAVQGALCKIRSRAISACLVGFCARPCCNLMQSMRRMLCSRTSHRPHKRTNRNATTSTSTRKTFANTCASCKLKSVRGLPQTCSAASRPRLPPSIMGPKRPDAPPGAWQQRQTAALWTYRQQVEYICVGAGPSLHRRPHRFLVDPAEKPPAQHPLRARGDHRLHHRASMACCPQPS